MTFPVGYLVAAAQLGLGAILVKPRRGIGQFTAMVTIEEQHEDTLEITEHPVEQGAVISDFAYKLPARVVIRAGWSNSPARSGLVDGIVGAVSSTVSGVSSILSGQSPSQVNDIYQRLLKLQAQAVPFNVYTGKRVYTDMLLKSLAVVTDRDTENALMVTATCQQLIIVKTAVVSVASDRSAQTSPEQTAPPVNSGTKSLQPGTAHNSVGGGRGFIIPPVITP